MIRKLTLIFEGLPGLGGPLAFLDKESSSESVSFSKCFLRDSLGLSVRRLDDSAYWGSCGIYSCRQHNAARDIVDQLLAP